VTAALLKMQLPDLSEILDQAGQADSMGLDSYGADSVQVPTSGGSAGSTEASTEVTSPETSSAGSSVSSISASPVSSYASALSSIPGKREHRFGTIHSRAQSPTSQSAFFSGSAVPVLSTSQHAIIKGYSDGFLTAEIFATYGLSKLGFTGQYIEDSLKSLGAAVIESGKEEYYREWFRKGLAHGEALVNNISMTVS